MDLKDAKEYFEERAAIRQHDGGMTRTAAEAAAQIDLWRLTNPHQQIRSPKNAATHRPT